MIKDELGVYYEGREAYLEGKEASMNPYTKEVANYWRNGWEDAKKGK